MTNKTQPTLNPYGIPVNLSALTGNRPEKKMATAYQWIITADHLRIDKGESDAGTMGPSDASLTYHQVKDSKAAVKFRMYDDDGELYYTGYVVFHPDRLDEVQGFEPLDDFGTPNAGCTIFRTHNPVTQLWDTV